MGCKFFMLFHVDFSLNLIFKLLISSFWLVSKSLRVHTQNALTVSTQVHINFPKCTLIFLSISSQFPVQLSLLTPCFCTYSKGILWMVLKSVFVCVASFIIALIEKKFLESLHLEKEKKRGTQSVSTIRTANVCSLL